MAVPAGAATGIDAVTVSKDTTTKPTVKFDTPYAIKKTADSVVAAGTGDALAVGQTITFDYVLVDGRTGKQIQTSYGGTQASLVLDAAKTNKQLVNAPHRQDGRKPRAPRDLTEGRPGQAAEFEEGQEGRHAAVRDRREERAHATGQGDR